MSDFKVAFIGLPSSGKSSIINSLIGKRLLESGICRTTIEYKLLDDIIEDDNNNKFKVIDLPGICDSEESNTNFNELTNEHIKDANLIIWTSDVNKAFITTHEVNEYNRIKEYIKNLNNDSGKLYYLIICLSKCDKDIVNKKIKTRKIKNNNEEITDSDEDTDIDDLIDKVKDKFSNEDIIYYNAFGKSYHNEKSSLTLKKFIEKNGIPSKYNITFDITKYMKDYDKQQENEYLNKFHKRYMEFLNNTLDFDKLLNIWNKLTNTDKNNHIDKICKEDFNKNFKIFQFIQEAKIYYSNLISNEINLWHIGIINNQLIYYYLFMLYDTKYIIQTYNYYISYEISDVINELLLTFSKLNKLNQQILYNKLLFDYKDFKIKGKYRIELINKIQEMYECNKYYYDFENNFNIFITNNFNKYNYFYDVITKIIEYNNYEFKYDSDKETIKEIFNNYISLLETISNDKDYILLNKLEILNNIYVNKNYNHNICSYYKLIKSFDYIPLSRLKINNEWNEINYIIWDKIYSNIQIENDFSYDTTYDFVAIDESELLYNIDVKDTESNTSNEQDNSIVQDTESANSFSTI
jgi:small GTP-binding protein